MLKLTTPPSRSLPVTGRLCSGSDCNESTPHRVMSNTTVKADTNQSSWIQSILSHFDSELSTSPHEISHEDGHEPVTLFLGAKAAQSVSKGHITTPVACLVMPHADGTHGWHIYHLLGLPEDKSADAFKELTGNLADLSKGAEIEGDTDVPVHAELGGSFGDTIQKVGSGIFRFFKNTISGGLSNVLGGVLGGLL